jgi:hypothetical protein
VLLGGCERSTNTKQSPQQPSYHVNFFVSNVSETQPATDLLIRWDTTVVAQDTFRYTNIGDSHEVFRLTTTPGEHHLRVINRANQLQLDSTIQVRDSLTHVFVGFNYRQVDARRLARIRQNF